MPNGEQQRKLCCFAGACRFVYNKALAWQKAQYEKGTSNKFSYAMLTNLLPAWKQDRAVLGEIKNITISQNNGKWYASIQTEREVEQRAHPNNMAVGIDLGVSKFATLSTGECAFFKSDLYMNKPMRLIVGLGNPGLEYAPTRHNVGFAWVDSLAKNNNSLLRLEAKFHGMSTKIRLHNQELHLLKPQTFMNLSGRSVLAIAKFYKILPHEMLIVHDELDLPTGKAKLKFDGGHGLRDMSVKLASTAFWRLGIGHPGHKIQVENYVLKPAARDKQISIDLVIDRGLSVLPEIMRGDFSAAMQKLHSL